MDFFFSRSDIRELNRQAKKLLDSKDEFVDANTGSHRILGRAKSTQFSTDEIRRGLMLAKKMLDGSDVSPLCAWRVRRQHSQCTFIEVRL